MNVRVIAANLAVRLKTFTRDKSTMFFTVAFPVILVLVFGTIFTKPDHLNFDLPVQDFDKTEASQKFIDSLTHDQMFKVTAAPTDIDAAAYARQNKLNLVLVIPKGFREAGAKRAFDSDNKASVAVTYVYDPSSTSVPKKIALLDAVVAAANQEISGTPPFITTIQKSILAERYRFIEFFVPGIIAMAIMTSSLSGALNINAELRQKGILRKLMTTPISRTDWLLSNILYQIVLAVISTTAILLVSRLVFDVNLRLNLWLPLFIVLAVFAFVGIGMLLTPIAKEAESAAAAGNAVLFPMMFLSGTFFPVEMMPGFLQTFARALPLFYVNEGLRSAMIFTDDAAALRCAAVIAAVGVVVFLLGSRITRWSESA